jgi:hypothetical protein
MSKKAGIIYVIAIIVLAISITVYYASSSAYFSHSKNQIQPVNNHTFMDKLKIIIINLDNPKKNKNPILYNNIVSKNAVTYSCTTLPTISFLL